MASLNANNYHLLTLFLCMDQEDAPVKEESFTKKLARLRKRGGIEYAKAKQAIHCVFSGKKE